MSLREKLSEEKIQFEASEDLFDSSKTQILLFKDSSKYLKLNINSPRPFSSLCFEFCGLTGLSYQTLRFRNLNKDVPPETKIATGCHVSVIHKVEFSLEPGSSLRACLRSILQKASLWDIEILLNSGSSFKLHRSLLACRSGQFSAFFKHFESHKDNKSKNQNIKNNKLLPKNFKGRKSSELKNLMSSQEIRPILKKCPSGPEMNEIKSGEKFKPKWNVSEIHDFSGENSGEDILSKDGSLGSEDQSLDGLKFKEIKNPVAISFPNIEGDLSSSFSLDDKVEFNSHGGFLKISFIKVCEKNGN